MNQIRINASNGNAVVAAKVVPQPKRGMSAPTATGDKQYPMRPIKLFDQPNAEPR